VWSSDFYIITLQAVDIMKPSVALLKTECIVIFQRNTVDLYIAGDVNAKERSGGKTPYSST
jgi:hypothetical protein